MRPLAAVQSIGRSDQRRKNAVPGVLTSELQYPRARSRDIRWSKPLNFMIPEAFSHDCAAGK